ncbi:cytochrome C assembly family protein [Caviibacterium pharyngocola]|uniref:ABC transporter permease n=1 Tax=Caviibacterium pharyngocola TaxID=28159 RepID=A0A2M8RVD7_9PAST|nr:cytochrome c biogenesis protein CcsA [Caviibacterium pharyngocola]PJG82851.1 ABC transporter permease [Caviibacterium pharyngocola]
MWFAISSMLLYLLSILLIVPMLLKAQAGAHTEKPNKILFFSTALLAIIAHCFSLFPLLTHLFGGENFTLMQIGSSVSVIVAALATAAMCLKVNTLWFLLPIVYCFSIITLILQTCLPGSVVQHLSQNTGLLIHIALALFAYAVCFIATLYAVQLGWIDHNLKHKKMSFSPIVPPLMTVERHFFRSMLSGEILLTLTLLSGSIYLADFFAASNIQKAAFSFLAWIVFGLALIGHWKLHWRGKKMIIYTISGMILLTIAYFGSRVMFDL